MLLLQLQNIEGGPAFHKSMGCWGGVFFQSLPSKIPNHKGKGFLKSLVIRAKSSSFTVSQAILAASSWGLSWLYSKENCHLHAVFDKTLGGRRYSSKSSTFLDPCRCRCKIIGKLYQAQLVRLAGFLYQQYGKQHDFTQGARFNFLPASGGFFRPQGFGSPKTWWRTGSPAEFFGAEGLNTPHPIWVSSFKVQKFQVTSDVLGSKLPIVSNSSI